MASKIKKGFTAEVAGILDINNDGIFIEVEDVDNPINLAEFIKDFAAKDIKISIGYKEEL